MRSSRNAKGETMRANILLLPMVLLGFALLGCAPKGRLVAQITTREGATYTVVEPQANYLRVCWQSEIDISKLADHHGLRIFSREKVTAGQDADEIPWTKIDSVDFGASSGELGEFCPGMPLSVAADVRFKDGHTEHHDLTDTTDDGIDGLSARGKIVIPVREIAHLSMIPDQNWPWSIAPESPKSAYTAVLTITDWDGSTTELPNPNISLTTSKQSGNDSLESPFAATADGLPAVISGAKLDIPWHSLKSVDFEPLEAGKSLRAKATFVDGHSEEFAVREGSLVGAEEKDETPFDDVKHLDVQTRPGSSRK
jgi:hypothetical protein